MTNTHMCLVAVVLDTAGEKTWINLIEAELPLLHSIVLSTVIIIVATTTSSTAMRRTNRFLQKAFSCPIYVFFAKPGVDPTKLFFFANEEFLRLSFAGSTPETEI